MVRKVPVRPTPAEQWRRMGEVGGERERVWFMKARRWEGESGTPGRIGKGCVSWELGGNARAGGGKDEPWSPHPRYST